MAVAPLTQPLAIDAWASAAEIATAFGQEYPLSDVEGFGVVVNGNVAPFRHWPARGSGGPWIAVVAVA